MIIKNWYICTLQSVSSLIISNRVRNLKFNSPETGRYWPQPPNGEDNAKYDDWIAIDLHEVRLCNPRASAIPYKVHPRHNHSQCESDQCHFPIPRDGIYSDCGKSCNMSVSDANSLKNYSHPTMNSDICAPTSYRIEMTMQLAIGQEK